MPQPDMNSETTQFYDILLKIQESFLEEIKNSSAYLYHYTKLETLKNIFKSCSIRLSDNSSLDKAHQEIMPAKTIILDILNGICFSDKKKNDIFSEVKEYFANHSLNCYIACFCKKYDSGKMWKDYGDGGNGICIEFDVHENEHKKYFTILGRSPHYFRLNTVIYDEAQLRRIVVESLNRTFHELYKNTKNFERFKGQIQGLLLYAVYLYKEKYFSDEDEVRLFADNDKLQYYSTNPEGKHKQYILSHNVNKAAQACGKPELPPITRIFVGSEKNIDKVKSIVKKFNRKISIETVENFV